MDGTESLRDGNPSEEPLVPVVSIRLAGLRALQTTDDEGDPVLVVSDGETTIEFLCGLPGLSDVSVRGAARLMEAIETYGAEIAKRKRPVAD